MLVGGDLGFPRLVLVVVVVLVFPVIGFVVRRKWRFAAARSEEIKRLLVLASEESARAELEANCGYGASAVASYSQQLQFQCAVCFCPTTTRCARCKAVRYCSGRCQIIHWRQGHKEECHPFTIIDPSNEGEGSSQKVLHQEEYESHNDSSESEGRHYAERVETIAKEFSNPGNSEVMHGKDDIEVVVDGPNGSLSEPSISSSGFWDGTINSRRSRTDSSESVRDTMSGPRSSLGFSFDLAKDIVSPAPLRVFNTKTTISDDDPSTPGIKKHTDEAALLDELCKDDLKSRKSPSLPAETSMNIHVETCSDPRVLKSREIKSSSSSAYCVSLDASNGVASTIKDAKVVNNSPSLTSERSTNMATDTRNSSRALRSQEVGSSLCKDSDVRLTSSSGRESGQTANLLKVDAGIHGATTCASQVPCDSQNVRNGLKTSMLKVVDQVKVSKFSSNYPSGAVSETAGRYTVKGLFPYELFVNLYHWNKVELHPRGLINCGNSCYANAVLQCLAFTPPLTAYFLQGLHSKSCEKREWCFTCEFESLIRKSKEGKSPLSAFRILSQIDKIGSNLGYGKEEDAHEFLRYAINNMQSVFLEEARSKTGSFDEETTLTGLTFGGYLRSKIKCLKCGGKSERHERIMDLSVEIDGNICTLEEALRQFTCTEILDGENKYQCSRCKSYEKAKKKLTIVEAPNVLTIALKRFQSGKFGKLTKSIQFPEILNMAPYISGTSDKSPVYRLYGVVVHLDVMNSSFSGHYVCYVKNIQNNWFKIDDSTVNAVELEMVLTKGAYMLLYARCSPRAPKLIRNSIVPRDPKKTKSTSFKSRSHSTGPCDALRTDSLNCRTRAEGFYPDQSSFQRIISPILEEDSSSEKSSSFFSEAGSCSTESSTRDSMSADDYFDQIFGDLGHNWNSSWRNSSDSDTSSSSSSSSPPPVFSRHSALSNSGHCSSKNPKSVPILCADVTKQRRKLDDSSSSSSSSYSSSSSSSSSCRETDSDRLGRLDPFNGVKSGISLRRSMRGRTD